MMTTVDLERVKQLTLGKVAEYEKQPKLTFKKLLPVAAIVAAASLMLLGAAAKLDWRVMVNGKIQQGNYGDTIVVGDGFAAMTPMENESNEQATIVVDFPDDQPDRIAVPGELSLFYCKSQDGSFRTGLVGIVSGESLDLEHCKQLLSNAEVPTVWPAAITSDYKLISNYTQFYAKKSQLKDAELLYSYWGEWKNQQLFAMPKGYEKYIDSVYLELETPTGDDVTFGSHLATTDSQVYGGGNNSNIEQLDTDDYSSVVFVADDGWNQLYAWKKIKKVNTIDLHRFGENERPKENLFSTPLHDAVYQWQQYSFTSYTLGKDELVKLLDSIDITA